MPDVIALSLETATFQTGVALGGSEGPRASFHVKHERRHTEILAPAIEFVCHQAGVPLERVDLIGVDIGPGLFSGLRAGVATANALAYACRIPVIGVSSLDVLAFAVRASAPRIIAVMDALSDEVYYATYIGDGVAVRQVSAPVVAKVEEIVEYLEALEEECIVVGDGAVRHSGRFTGIENVTVAQEEFQFPSAGALLALSVARVSEDGPSSRSAPEIVYLREPYVHRRQKKDKPA